MKLLLLFIVSLWSITLSAAQFQAGDCYKTKEFPIESYYAQVVGILPQNYLVISTKLGKYDRTVAALPMEEVDKHMEKISCPK